MQFAAGAEGVAVALGMEPPDITSLHRERRAHRLTDLAHSYTYAGQREKAIDALLNAEKKAGQEVVAPSRIRQPAKYIRLLCAGPAEGRLRALAARCGLPQ